jgi:hypothetical protein
MEKDMCKLAFTKSALLHDVLKNSYIEFHENATKGLINDVMSQPLGRTEGRPWSYLKGCVMAQNSPVDV